MKSVKILLSVAVLLAVPFAIPPIRQATITWIRVNLLDVGAEDYYVWLPNSSARLVRLDSWQLKEMLGTPVLVLTIYNGSDWKVGGVEVVVTNGYEKRSFRCTVRTSAEVSGTFVAGEVSHISTKEAGVAVCEVGTFAKKDSSVAISSVNGWKP